jgi:HlyD family secretion protein
METRAARRPRRGRLVRRLLVALLACALVGVVAYGAWPRPIPVDAVGATRRALRISIDESGKTRVRDRYVVSAPIAGDLARIELRPGDEIEAGAALARLVPLAPPLLDPRARAEAEARLGAASSALAQARTVTLRAEVAAKHAEDDLAKARTLAGSGAIAGEALDHAELEARLRDAELVSARFSERMAAFEVQLATSTIARFDPKAARADQFAISSPVRGRVLRVLQESAGVVAPGTPLLELGDPSSMEVVVDVLSADAVRIHVGASATLEAWGGEPLRAKVRVVEPGAFTKVSALGVEEQRVHVALDLLDPRERWSGLGDGYRVEAKIVVSERAGVLVVPAGAVFRRDEEWAVYALERGRVRVRALRVGERNDRDVEVLEGVREGELVIVHPSERITDGVRGAPR